MPSALAGGSFDLGESEINANTAKFLEESRSTVRVKPDVSGLEYFAGDVNRGADAPACRANCAMLMR